MSNSRRYILCSISGSIAAVSGCTGNKSDSDTNREYIESEIECEGSHDSTEDLAIRKYRSIYEDRSSVDRQVGIAFSSDSNPHIFDGSAAQRMQWDDFYEAVNMYDEAIEMAERTIESSEELLGFVDSCNPIMKDGITENTEAITESVAIFKNSSEHFIKACEVYVKKDASFDDEISEATEYVNKGISEARRAKEDPPMSPSEMSSKIEYESR